MSDVQDILIKVEPEKLEALAGRVNSKIEAIRGRFERIESEVNNSNHYWKGEEERLTEEFTNSRKKESKKVWKILKEWYLHWKQWQELIEVQKRK